MLSFALFIAFHIIVHAHENNNYREHLINWHVILLVGFT